MSDGNNLVDFRAVGHEDLPGRQVRADPVGSRHGLARWLERSESRRLTDPRSIPLARAIGDDLYLMELDDALATIQRDTGLDKFEMIGMDACLMSHLEVYNALEPYAALCGGFPRD